MAPSNEVKTIAETIVWIADERIKAGQAYQNRASAIYSVNLEVSNELIEHMKERNDCHTKCLSKSIESKGFC